MQFLAPAGLARRVAIAAAFLVACLAVNGALSASAGSLPGDPLYGVKRIQEQLRLSLTVDAAAREKLQQQIDDTRVAELNAIRRMLRVVRTEVSGTVNAIDGDTLVVDQVPFTVDHTLFPTLSNVKVGDRVTLTVQTNSDGSAVVVDLKLDTPAKPGTASVGGNGGTAIPTEALEATPRPTTAKAALTAEPPESSPPATNPAQTRAPVPSAAATSQPGGSTHGSPTPGVLKQFTAAPPSTLIGTPLPDDNQHVPTPDDFRRTPLPTSRPDITNTPSPTETRGPTQHPEATGTQRPPETPIASNTPRPTATRDATSVKELTAEPSATKSPTAAGTPDQ